MFEFHKHKSKANSSAEICRESDLQSLHGLGFCVWQVQAQSIEYQYHNGHTLSLYLKGGRKTYRTDKPDEKGEPGRICLMPKGHLSHWRSPETIRIAHLYLPDAHIKQAAEQYLDIDARQANLRDLIYQKDHNLSQQILGLVCGIHNNKNIEPMFIEQQLHAITLTLLEQYLDGNKHPVKTLSGLSPSDRKKIKTFIRHSLNEKLSICLLAEQVHLSPYHFAKMFKLSFGDSPANYIIRQRNLHAQQLLAGSQGIAEIAHKCGFTHQSHFTNSFKKQFGVTPTRYRKLR